MFTINDCGCYFDGARGFKDIAVNVVEFAQTYGFKVSDKDFAAAKENEYDNDALHWLWDEAEDYLNTKCAPDDCYFGSNESGDWGLWANDDTDNDCQ